MTSSNNGIKGLLPPSAGAGDRIRAHAAIALAKFLKTGLRIAGRAGTALPGKSALKLQPKLLPLLTENRLVYLVTGTNGKTTTVRILCTILEEQGYNVITNPSGANLDSGLTTTLIDHSKILKNTPDNKLAIVLEIDEAFFAKLAGSLNPTVIVVTNFFRDQLDRYGELQHTRDLIARGLDQTEAQLVLCADDSLCASLARGREQRSHFFGMDTSAMQPGKASGVLESGFCTFCGSRYEYKSTAYGHLGDFICPSCGFARPHPELLFTAGADPDGLVQAQQLNLSRITADGQALSVQARLSVPGIHNAYNASGAILAALLGGSDLDQLAQALPMASAAFGRMERFAVGKREVSLILVKNPVGMDRALEFVLAAEDFGSCMMLLNANDPDGRDVSWIWDVDFEDKLPQGRIGISGIRRADLALRL
ncbi:MAG: DUF1727 domain-containing protein, partial [Clostridiaceae bacterium]|nr:DUF1727 domain-containing protein [Clostridiaceae bacterium]